MEGGRIALGDVVENTSRAIGVSSAPVSGGNCGNT